SGPGALTQAPVVAGAGGQDRLRVGAQGPGAVRGDLDGRRVRDVAVGVARPHLVGVRGAGGQPGVREAHPRAVPHLVLAGADVDGVRGVSVPEHPVRQVLGVVVRVLEPGDPYGTR